MKTLTDAKEIEAALKGCELESICQAQDDHSIEMYFTNGACICIEAALVPFIDVTPNLEIEVRLK